MAPSSSFDFTQCFQPIIDEFAMAGREVQIKKKDNTDVYDVTFQMEKSIKTKIEVDAQPSLQVSTEQKLFSQNSRNVLLRLTSTK